MLATAAHCVSVTGLNLLYDLNKRLMLNNNFKTRTIEILEKRLKSFKLIMRSFNKIKFLKRKGKLSRTK